MQRVSHPSCERQTVFAGPWILVLAVGNTQNISRLTCLSVNRTGLLISFILWELWLPHLGLLNVLLSVQVEFMTRENCCGDNLAELSDFCVNSTFLPHLHPPSNCSAWICCRNCPLIYFKRDVALACGRLLLEASQCDDKHIRPYPRELNCRPVCPLWKGKSLWRHFNLIPCKMWQLVL